MLDTPSKEIDANTDAMIVAQVVALVHSRRKGDYLSAADAHRALVRLGVLVKFPTGRKGAVNNGR